MTSAVQSVDFLSILNDSTSSSIWRSTRGRNPSCVRSAAELLDRRPTWWDEREVSVRHFLTPLFSCCRSNTWRPTGRSPGGWRTPSTAPAPRGRSRSPSSRESSSSEPGPGLTSGEICNITTRYHHTRYQMFHQLTMLSTLYIFISFSILFISI